MIIPPAASGPAPPRASSTEKAAAVHAPRYGMYPPTKVTAAIVPTSGTPEDERAERSPPPR